MFVSRVAALQSTNGRPGINDTFMSWQGMLACIGSVIGVVTLLYLMCRWCRHIDPLSYSDEPLGGEERAAAVPHQTAVPIERPSAEAVERYYSRR